MKNPIICFCGSDKSFEQCCNLYLDGVAVADTAEILMRSRYSAFKSKNYNYLISTHHFSDRKNKLSIEDFDQTIEWLGLTILSTQQGGKSDTTGEVEFVAFFKSLSATARPNIEQIHEKSSFVRINDQWLYTSGKPLPPIKLSRNSLCFCNSGKKYKKCHAN